MRGVGEQAARVIAFGGGLDHHGTPRPDSKVRYEERIGASGNQLA